MDKEQSVNVGTLSFRLKTVQDFFKCLDIPYTPQISKIIEEWGIKVVEDMKLVNKSMWDGLATSATMNHVQRFKLLTAVEKVCNSWEHDPFLSKNIPIKDTDEKRTQMSYGSGKGSSKKVSSSKTKPRGGNLPLMTNFFSILPEKKKAKLAHKEPTEVIEIHETSSNSSDSEANIAGLVEAPTWRHGRTKDSAEELERLHDPAPEHEKALWNYKLVSSHQEKPTCNNFEDIYGHYSAFGEDFSRITSDRDIELRYKEMKKQWHTDALKYHPDKNTYKDAAEKFRQYSDAWEKAQNAYTYFYGQHVAYAGGISGRLHYDRRCDTVRMCWQVKVQYDDDVAKVEFANIQKEKKRNIQLQPTENYPENYPTWKSAPVCILDMVNKPMNGALLFML